MSSFVNTISPTPFSFFNTDASFQQEADNVFEFVKFNLGDSVVDVELTKKTVWANLEFATLEFGSIVNEFQAKSQLTDFLGLATGSLPSGSIYPRENLEFLARQAEPYSHEIGFGGSYDTISGSIKLKIGEQDYNIYEELVDSDNNPIFQSQQTSGSRGKLKILEVYHVDPDVSFLALTNSPAINYLSSEFNFESFSRGTHFYVLPVFEDHLRMSMYDLAFKIRRSNFSYRIHGSGIRIYPKPVRANDAKRLFIRVMIAPDPRNPTAFHDDTIYGVSNMSNMPLGNIPFNQINDVGRQWIRKYALALCKETLGLIRRKITRIPIPNDYMELDGAPLVQEGREEKAQLIEQLRDTLEQLTYYNLAALEAEKAENMSKQLSKVPFRKPIWIV